MEHACVVYENTSKTLDCGPPPTHQTHFVLQIPTTSSQCAVQQVAAGCLPGVSFWMHAFMDVMVVFLNLELQVMVDRLKLQNATQRMMLVLFGCCMVSCRRAAVCFHACVCLHAYVFMHASCMFSCMRAVVSMRIS